MGWQHALVEDHGGYRVVVEWQHDTEGLEWDGTAPLPFGSYCIEVRTVVEALVTTERIQLGSAPLYGTWVVPGEGVCIAARVAALDYDLARDALLEARATLQALQGVNIPLEVPNG
jgi:hypothetical protein